MPEPFKNKLDVTAVRAMAGHLKRVAPDFNGDGFVEFVLRELEALELKQRSTRITDALERFLPRRFPEAVDILLASLDPATGQAIGETVQGVTERGIRGWPVMAMADFVAKRGQDEVELSLSALKTMTALFSSEFAIRAFLVGHPASTLAILTDWIDDDDEHTRRLVSEGTRPRLPWATRLPAFIADPSPVLGLLERLKDDPSEYVRRSVANNLNDIAKDHPDLIAELARGWLEDASEERRRLVRHGLRSLIKAGHPGALDALGFGPAKVKLLGFELRTPTVVMGEALEFAIELVSTAKTEQALIIDYNVHHMRANGRLGTKVFKWKTLTLSAGKKHSALRRHPFKVITTRRYYAGRHRVEIIVNGECLGGVDFRLEVE